MRTKCDSPLRVVSLACEKGLIKKFKTNKQFTKCLPWARYGAKCLCALNSHTHSLG